MSYKFNPFTGTLDYYENTATTKLPNIGIFEAGEVISALQLVRASDLDTVLIGEPNTYTNSKCLGVALSTVAIGEVLNVQEFGKLEDAFFNFPLNEPLFLGANGLITDVAPVAGFSINIGHGLGAGAIFIDIREQIEL